MSLPHAKAAAAAAVSAGLLLCALPWTAAAVQEDDADRAPVSVSPRAADARSNAAARALMTMYNDDTGLFENNGWWTGANALTAIMSNIADGGVQDHRYAIARTYERNITSHEGDFTNEFLDDTGWWGLAWIKAYDLTGDTRYLDTARADAAHMADYWTDRCGGGVQWKVDDPYKNAVTNELYLQLNAALHNRIPGDTFYLQKALKEWEWFQNSGMINSNNMINDGLGDNCANNGHPTYTYNQGIVLGGLAELHRATGDDSLMDTARTLANASTTSSGIHTSGILREPGGENTPCSSDGGSFKGAYVRGLGDLNQALDDRPYSAYLDRQADSAYNNARNAQGFYGSDWSGPVNQTSHQCQQSALDVLNAAAADGGGGARSGAVKGVNGKCLDVNGGATADGTQVQLWNCNGTGAQNWTLPGDSTFRALGKCLDVSGAGTANGTKIQLWTCNGTGAQQWQPQSDGTVRNPNSGKCLDAEGGTWNDGTRVHLWSCHTGPNQKWTLP
ncbi:glycoside hydrolase family 76 protein [Streptomyces sp. NPDC056405]|uniref:glycoside hydrolase family 76 protein n=1 Tax=Streptomyces sp. NPDC056405 TaxID=3345811 RepID=UPI0035D78D00